MVYDVAVCLVSLQCIILSGCLKSLEHTCLSASSARPMDNLQLYRSIKSGTFFNVKIPRMGLHVLVYVPSPHYTVHVLNKDRARREIECSRSCTRGSTIFTFPIPTKA
jgi:hypothetical protein